MSESWYANEDRPAQVYKGTGYIPVIGPFSEEMQISVISLILQAKRDGKKVIRLLIDSPGGDSSVCAAIKNTIQLAGLAGIKSTGLVLSKAHSSGFIILQACDTRLAIEGTTILFHFGSMRLSNNEIAVVLQGKTWLYDHMRAMYDPILEELSRRSGQSIEDLISFASFERYLMPSEALTLKFIDEIVPYPSKLTPKILKLLEEPK